MIVYYIKLILRLNFKNNGINVNLQIFEFLHKCIYNNFLTYEI